MLGRRAQPRRRRASFLPILMQVDMHHPITSSCLSLAAGRGGPSATQICGDERAGRTAVRRLLASPCGAAVCSVLRSWRPRAGALWQPRVSWAGAGVRPPPWAPSLPAQCAAEQPEQAFRAAIARLLGRWRWAGRLPEVRWCGGGVGLRVWREHGVLRPAGAGRVICAPCGRTSTEARAPDSRPRCRPLPGPRVFVRAPRLRCVDVFVASALLASL